MNDPVYLVQLELFLNQNLEQQTDQKKIPVL